MSLSLGSQTLQISIYTCIYSLLHPCFYSNRWVIYTCMYTPFTSVTHRKQPAGISHCANSLHMKAFVCMESKFHNLILQVREPSSLQASNRMLVSSYTGKSQVKQNDLCLPCSEATTSCRTTEAHVFPSKDLSPIASLGS